MYNRIIKFSLIVLTFLLPLFFLPFSFEAFEFNKQYLLFFFTSLALFCWLAKMISQDKEIKFKRTPLDLPVLVFLLIAILGAVFSVDKTSSLFGFYGRFSDGLVGLLSLGALYFLITNNVSPGGDKEQKTLSIPSLLKAFVWSIFFVVIISYLSIFGVFAKINTLLAGKIALPQVMSQSTFNPAAGSLEGLAMFLAVVLVFLIGRVLVINKGIEKKGNFVNYFLMTAIFILLFLIDFSPAWLTIIISLILFLGVALAKRIFKEDVNKLLLPIAIAIMAGAMLLINTAGIQSWLFKSQLPKEQVLTQAQSWPVGLKGATENVKAGFLGSGLGTWSYDFAKFKPVSFNQNWLWQIRFDRSGNSIAEILGNTGFLGFLVYFVLIGMFLLASYFFLVQSRSGIPLLIGFLALLVAQFVYYQNTILAFAFWLLLGLSVVNWQKPVREKIISFKDFPELSLIFSAVLLVFGLVFLGMYFFAAKFYLADVNYKKAVVLASEQNLVAATSLNPYQPQYKIVLARSYLNDLLTETQKSADLRDQNAISVYVQEAITFAKGGQIGKTNIVGATDLAPNRVAAWETLGMIYRDIQGLAAGSLDWGIKSFEKAVSLEPTNPVLHTELGKLYLTSGDKEKAVNEFDKAKTLKPDYSDASIQLALLQEQNNDVTTAIKTMTDLANAYPLDTDVLFQLGRLYFNANRVDEAINQFQAVITLSPNHSNAHYSLGVAYQKKGDKNKAIAEFQKVLELNPGNTDVQAKLKSLGQ